MSHSRPRSRRNTLYLGLHSRSLVAAAPRRVCWSCDGEQIADYGDLRGLEGEVERACGSLRSVLQSLKPGLDSAAPCCGRRPRLSRSVPWHGVAFLSRWSVLSDGRARTIRLGKKSVHTPNSVEGEVSLKVLSARRPRIS
ncbi:hypothetical protein EXIGLDRAFT_406836 [Exidia glandulosa HHB12029]|uniref:Uncharacterized protein n=1 Tax=Exidia glandulosa HHB12029 TaxID=1314781 RepID=A0A165BI76_EXIGL|nr:hypothetical protein EXIGLDRAFT_406836 [Exidia glandulosa HHB12029]